MVFMSRGHANLHDEQLVILWRVHVCQVTHLRNSITMAYYSKRKQESVCSIFIGIPSPASSL